MGNIHFFYIPSLPNTEVLYKYFALQRSALKTHQSQGGHEKIPGKKMTHILKNLNHRMLHRSTLPQKRAGSPVGVRSSYLGRGPLATALPATTDPHFPEDYCERLVKEYVDIAKGRMTITEERIWLFDDKFQAWAQGFTRETRGCWLCSGPKRN